MTSESVVFRGITFRRYPDSKRRTDRLYFAPNGTYRAKGMGRLHEEIWKAAHGPIPEGHHIHHVDHDPLNNDLSNLACITAAEHVEHHAKSKKADPRYTSPEWLEHLARNRVKAAEWHRSPKGRAWHSQHAIRAAAQKPLSAGVCDQCGNAFTSKSPQRFCSNKCKSAWRRASGVDNETRDCKLCGSGFTVNKHARVMYCSRSCASRSKFRMTPP